MRHFDESHIQQGLKKRLEVGLAMSCGTQLKVEFTLMNHSLARDHFFTRFNISDKEIQNIEDVFTIYETHKEKELSKQKKLIENLKNYCKFPYIHYLAIGCVFYNIPTSTTLNVKSKIDISLIQQKKLARLFLEDKFKNPKTKSICIDLIDLFSRKSISHLEELENVLLEKVQTRRIEQVKNTMESSIINRVKELSRLAKRDWWFVFGADIFSAIEYVLDPNEILTEAMLSRLKPMFHMFRCDTLFYKILVFRALSHGGPVRDWLISNTTEVSAELSKHRVGLLGLQKIEQKSVEVSSTHKGRGVLEHLTLNAILFKDSIGLSESRHAAHIVNIHAKDSAALMYFDMRCTYTFFLRPVGPPSMERVFLYLRLLPEYRTHDLIRTSPRVTRKKSGRVFIRKSVVTEVPAISDIAELTGDTNKPNTKLEELMGRLPQACQKDLAKFVTGPSFQLKFLSTRGQGRWSNVDAPAKGEKESLALRSRLDLLHRLNRKKLLERDYFDSLRNDVTNTILRVDFFDILRAARLSIDPQDIQEEISAILRLELIENPVSATLHSGQTLNQNILQYLMHRTAYRISHQLVFMSANNFDGQVHANLGHSNVKHHLEATRDIAFEKATKDAIITKSKQQSSQKWKNNIQTKSGSTSIDYSFFHKDKGTIQQFLKIYMILCSQFLERSFRIKQLHWLPKNLSQSIYVKLRNEYELDEPGKISKLADAIGALYRREIEGYCKWVKTDNLQPFAENVSGLIETHLHKLSDGTRAHNYLNWFATQFQERLKTVEEWIAVEDVSTSTTAKPFEVYRLYGELLNMLAGQPLRAVKSGSTAYVVEYNRYGRPLAKSPRVGGSYFAMMRVIMENIISNGIKYSGFGSKTAFELQINIIAQRENDKLELVFRNSMTNDIRANAHTQYHKTAEILRTIRAGKKPDNNTGLWTIYHAVSEKLKCEVKLDIPQIKKSSTHKPSMYEVKLTIGKIPNEFFI